MPVGTLSRRRVRASSCVQVLVVCEDPLQLMQVKVAYFDQVVYVSRREGQVLSVIQGSNLRQKMMLNHRSLKCKPTVGHYHYR